MDLKLFIITFIVIFSQSFSYERSALYGDEDDPNPTLMLVHVLFRHGDRTNIRKFVYPKDPHRNISYYPYGYGQLTKKGKNVEYILGQHLRSRYDEFLGKIYTPHIIDARSSDTNRTKMSLELVLAGLFPPVGDQVWNSNINWQPIPYNFSPKELDKLFFGVLCPNYKKALAEYKQSPEYINKITQYQSLFRLLSDHTGRSVTDDIAIFKLYNGMVVEEENGLKLPRWTSSVYPQPMKDIAINTYYTETATTELKKLGSGFLLRKMINDSITKIENISGLQDRKMFLYSGHEFNLAFFLITLGVFEPQIPPYGSHIMLELHNIHGLSGFKIFYHDYSTGDTPPLRIPGCDEFCPVDQFISLLQKYIPEDSECGREEIKIT